MTLAEGRSGKNRCVERGTRVDLEGRVCGLPVKPIQQTRSTKVVSQIFSLLSQGTWREDGRRGRPAGTERLDLSC